jgi:RNA polymerase sigma-70 factor (sigma-B/F/G subfamily)
MLGGADVPAARRERIRAQIVELNLPFAVRLTRRYRNRGQAADDLAQVAAVALIKAVNGYDPELGKPFFAYLMPTVLGELRKHFRDTGWAVHVDRGLQERHLELVGVRTSLTQRLRRPPTIEDLAAELKIEPAQAAEAWKAGNAYAYDSLNVPVSSSIDGAERIDLLGGDDPDLASVSDRLALRELVRRLPERERYILTRYFFGEASQQQIAAEIGMSQMNVSRLLRRTLESLRRQLDGQAGTLPAAADLVDIRTQVTPGGASATVAGDVDDRAAAQLRDMLVDLVVRERPRRLIVDLHGVGTAGGRLVRALVDTYRAGGHSGTRLAVVNVPSDLFHLLSRLGVTRLFPCRAAERSPRPDNAAPEPGDGWTPPSDGPIDVQADPGKRVSPLDAGQRAASRRDDRRLGSGCASLAHGGTHRRSHRRHDGRNRMPAGASRPPPGSTSGLSPESRRRRRPAEGRRRRSRAPDG